MVSPNVASRFWRVASGRFAVFVEGVSRDGWFISNNNARLRVTTSNLAHGEVVVASTERLERVDVDRLRDALRDRTPVIVHVETHVLGNPLRGDVVGGTYVKSVNTTTLPTVTSSVTVM